MLRRRQLEPRYVDEMPSEIADGILYISKRFNTASHRCCCGCGIKIVTPLNPAKWRLIEHQGAVSLTPSIGNWSLPCRSHYWIEKNRVRWAGKMHESQVRWVQERDDLAVRKWANARGAESGLNAPESKPAHTQPQQATLGPLRRLLAWLRR